MIARKLDTFLDEFYKSPDKALLLTGTRHCGFKTILGHYPQAARFEVVLPVDLAEHLRGQTIRGKCKHTYKVL